MLKQTTSTKNTDNLDKKVRTKSGEARKIMSLGKVFLDTDSVRFLWF